MDEQNTAAPTAADEAAAAPEAQATDAASPEHNALDAALERMAQPSDDAPPAAQTPDTPNAQNQAGLPQPPQTAQAQPSGDDWLDALPQNHRAAAAAVVQERQQLAQQLSDMRQAIASSGMNAQQLAQSLEYGRLINNGDEASLKAALDILEAQRAHICTQLGITAPGIDPLDQYDDLKAAVGDFTISREHAQELARLRHAQQQVLASQAAQRQEAAAAAQYERTVQAANAQMQQFFASREHTADHQARLQAIAAHFQNPANVQQFVQTYEPHQWTATLAMMYEHIRPQAPTQPQPKPQPLSQRTSAAAASTWVAHQPQANAQAANIDRLAQRLSGFGI